MNAAPPNPYFRCRTCGSRDYERVVVRKRDGKPYDTAFYACMGCTTMFGDPTKYTAPPPPLKVTRVDAPISFRRSRDGGRFAPQGITQGMAQGMAKGNTQDKTSGESLEGGKAGRATVTTIFSAPGAPPREPQARDE